MPNLCLNTRDELLMIHLSKVAYFQANGNYTQFVYICGEKHLVALGLSKIEEYIRLSWKLNEPSPFVRLGRSLIVNQHYVTEISVLRQRLMLSDCEGHNHPLSVSKQLLRQYKAIIYNINAPKEQS